ncbi:MAG: thermonuclease family protein [Anaerolineae bacterium]
MRCGSTPPNTLPRQGAFGRGALVVVLALLLIGLPACGELVDPSVPSPVRPTVVATFSPVAPFQPSPAIPVVTLPPGVQSAQVIDIVDGDTIRVEIGGERWTVRYIGIDTPELYGVDDQAEPYAVEATEANRRLVEGRTVFLERDVSESDRYWRLLRYVYVDGTFVNAELVRLGLAEARTYRPDTRRQDDLDAREAEARDARRGLWADAPEPTPIGDP